MSCALAAGLAGLAGCESDKVPIDSPSPAAADLDRCRALVKALPDTVDDELRRPVDPDDALGAAYGDPPIVVTCGGRMPASFDRFSTCQVADGVGWYVPEDQIGDQPVEVTMTTVGYRPIVSVRIPASYWPEGAASVPIDLAPSLKRTLRLVKPCR